MGMEKELNVFLQPESVAVIGATERPGAWGSLIMNGLQSLEYSGKVYPVNRRAQSVCGIRAFPNIRDIPHPVDLAVVAIPEHSIEECIQDCGTKGVKGITIITAGFGEAVKGGRYREEALAETARSYGMRILGPNVSGTFNLHSSFNASGSSTEHLFPTKLAAVCQGGYAFYDLLASGYARRMGVGKFIHTGNECDLQVTDFLDHFRTDPEVSGIVMYLETVRNGKRFMEVARRVAKEKPIVIHKAGRTIGGVRAARSHTGAIASQSEIYDGAFHQANLVLSPTMELLLPLAHSLLESPSMRGNCVAIITMGGSWGVPLTDCLEEVGLRVPELSLTLQKQLRGFGMPIRASTRNPVDIGAAGIGSFSSDALSEIGRIILSSGEIDALIFHGLGRPAIQDNGSSSQWKLFTDFEKETIKKVSAVQDEIDRPVMVGSLFSPWESQSVHDLNIEGLRIYNRLDEIAQILSLKYGYWRRNR
ncbi:MAG: CoA-binding protein [Thermodesulfobacteriota bacterium]|nr:CoA-binding protein [Thermodesulfobacteriota bacterium]